MMTGAKKALKQAAEKRIDVMKYPELNINYALQ